MTNESISNKLSELFELHKSGALTKEEYESLKSEIINQGKVQPIKEKKQEKEPEKVVKEEQIQEPKTTIIPDKPVKEIKQEPKSSIIPDKPAKEIKQEPKSSIIPDKPVKENKGRIIWLFSIIVGVCIIAFVIFKFTLFSTKSDVAVIQEQIVKDIDGNVYHTITIGTQVWMVENLKTTKYNDGTPIPLVTDNSAWRALKTPAYCWYNNDETANKNTYGALYNWYAVNTNKLCPIGWHVPSDSEWTTLTDYLSNNGFGYQECNVDISKSLANSTGWNASSEIGSVGNDPASNNKSGFTAFPGGIRFSNGEYRHGGQNGKWWSSTETSEKAAQIRFISWNDGIVTSYSNGKQNGFSVRCVKDSSTPEDNLSAINNPIVENKTAEWDTAIATKIIMDEIPKHSSDWSFDYEGCYEDLNHEVSSFTEIVLGNKELKLAVVHSNFVEGFCCPPYCGTFLSVFEFDYRNGEWRLNKEAINFHDLRNGIVDFYNISSNSYGIIVKERHVAGRAHEDTPGTIIRLYTFSNEELVNTFHLFHEQADNVEFSANIRTAVHNGQSYLQLEKKGETETETIYYKFNGHNYEEFQGGITDPSLTSMSRFMDINSLTQQKNNICSRCNGTGVEVCNLCNGTGVDNMGIECGCIRTYKMELAAGHTPSHPSRKWTCPRCGGTGKYEY